MASYVCFARTGVLLATHETGCDGLYKEWPQLLDVAQLSFNSKKSSSTNKSPFEIFMGQQPRLPHTALQTYQGKSPRAFNFTREWQRNIEIARAYLEKAAKRMKKWADRGRREQQFEVGDLVMVKLMAEQLRFLRNRDRRWGRMLWPSPL
ncbi:hypothetical protein V6N13_036672 [Hibiscus sabdariffa]